MTMTHDRNEESLGLDDYLIRARMERAKATRRFFRRLFGATDKAGTNNWG